MTSEIEKLKKEVDAIESAVKKALGSSEDGIIDPNDIELIRLDNRVQQLEETLNGYLEIKKSIAELKNRIKKAKESLSIQFTEKKADSNYDVSAGNWLHRLTLKIQRENPGMSYSAAFAEAQVRDPGDTALYIRELHSK